MADQATTELMHSNLFEVFGQRDPALRREGIARAPDGPIYADQDTAVLAWRLGPPAGEPVARGIDIAFDYVFRKGSSIRLWIDAPTGETGGWSFNFIPTPAINTIDADPQHPSAIVLGNLQGGHAGAPLPACNTVLNQPCRANETPVPSGTMTIP